MTEASSSRITAAVLTTEGDLTAVELPDGVTARIAALYGHLECRMFDVVAVADDLDMWIDDEGLLTNRAANRAASAVVVEVAGYRQRYVGTVVFTGGVDAQGDSLSLGQDRLQQIRRILAQ